MSGMFGDIRAKAAAAGMNEAEQQATEDVAKEIEERFTLVWSDLQRPETPPLPAGRRRLAESYDLASSMMVEAFSRPSIGGQPAAQPGGVPRMRTGGSMMFGMSDSQANRQALTQFFQTVGTLEQGDAEIPYENLAEAASVMSHRAPALAFLSHFYGRAAAVTNRAMEEHADGYGLESDDESDSEISHTEMSDTDMLDADAPGGAGNGSPLPDLSGQNRDQT